MKNWVGEFTLPGFETYYKATVILNVVQYKERHPEK